MGHFEIRANFAAVKNNNSGWFILEETGRRVVTSPLVSELIGLIHQSHGDEDGLVAKLADHFPVEQVYYALIQLEKQGVIVKSGGRQEFPADFFRAGLCGQKGTQYPLSPMPSLTVRIAAIEGSNADADADALAASLSRSDKLKAERVTDWRKAEMTTDAVYVMVTTDYLEPELEAFGHLAHERKLRWLPVKAAGVIPWMGPLFLPTETGCVECLFDRLRGHRRLEVDQISEDGGKRSLRLSVGQTIHSLETVAGLLAVVLEKLAASKASEMTGALFALDFRTLKLERHPLTKREQCPLCGTGSQKNTSSTVALPKEPLRLQSRGKADYRDGGERVCSAVETLENYAHLISPITGVVGQLTPLPGTPACFGQVINSDWNVRDNREKAKSEQSARSFPAGYSTGKGRTVPQARASALGEAIERYCSQYEGYETRFRATFTEIGGVAIHPYDLMGFSERQYRDREAWREKGDTAYVPDPYDAARPIDWSPAWSLTQDRWRLIPSAFAYYAYPREGGGDVCRGCSNGVAAGNCLEEAVMQGVFELVERDAMAMWWYHKLRKPALDLRDFESPFVSAVGAAMNQKGMLLEVLDLTTDLGIPVFSANLFNRGEELHFKSIGLGCHRDPRIALERAVSELGQSWTIPDWDAYSLKFQKTPLSRECFLQADHNQTPKRYSDFSSERRDDFLDDIEDVKRLLSERGLELLVIDLTRPDIGFPVARVIIPGIVHFWPRFGCRRLFEVPKTAGWIAGDAGEDDLNPVPFYW